MKRRFMTAMGIGFLISTVLMVMPSANMLGFLQFPAMGAAYLWSEAVGILSSWAQPSGGPRVHFSTAWLP